MKKLLTIGIAFAVIGMFIAPLAAFAEDGTTAVTGDVTSGYTFNPPAAIALGSMAPGSTVTGTNSGTLTGNNVAGYTVTAIDAKGTDTGFMVSGLNKLTNEFKIGSTVGNVANCDDAQTLYDLAGVANGAVVPLHVSQQVSVSDPVANGYSITITYTVTPKT